MYKCLTLAEIEAALDGVYQHIAIGEKIIFSAQIQTFSA